MKLKYLFAIFFVLIGLSGISQNSIFKAGAAVRIITPDPLIAVSG